ncbi:hypothetical protein TURU_021387 [Turdus rufiventris]|nr:hypothetical protein TURU_021387 [Turdus rufiventris]
MWSLLSRSVEIKISNNTQSITLRNPSTHIECGSCSRPPAPELLPGSSGTSQFLGSFPFRGVAGILVYEADSFTLAIYFSNPFYYNKFSTELGLELSLRKVHLGNLPRTYARMSSGSYSNSFVDTKFARVTVDENQGIADLSDGPIRVTANMSKARTSILRVLVEEQRGTEGRGQDADPLAM